MKFACIPFSDEAEQVADTFINDTNKVINFESKQISCLPLSEEDNGKNFPNYFKSYNIRKTLIHPHVCTEIHIFR